MADDTPTIRVLCSKLVFSKHEPSLQWLIGSPFFPPYTIVSTVRCIHFQQQSDRPLSPVLSAEANDLRTLIIKGFHVIGALIVGTHGESGEIAREAMDSALKLRNSFSGFDNGVDNSTSLDLIGGSLDSNGGEVRFFLSKKGIVKDLEAVSSIVYEEEPEKYIWERGCLLSCELPIKLPVYVSASKKSDAQVMYFGAHEALIAKFNDPQITFMVECAKRNAEEVSDPIIIRGVELDSLTEVPNFRLSDANMLPCSYFLADKKPISSVCAEVYQVTVLLNRSDKSSELNAPMAEFFPASEEARLWVMDYKLEVVCYAVKDLPLNYAISKLIIPALADQLNAMKSAIFPCFLEQRSQRLQLRPYHFAPPGILHPITVIYELTYGEQETKQGKHF